MPADLHIHSNLSDGTHSPEEVVELASAGGLKTIALTDHDIVDGIEPAQKKGKELNLEVIPGIEFTTEAPNCEVHILGYFIDYHNPKLLTMLEKIQADRVKRIYKIIEKLKELKVKIDPDEVLAISGKKAPGRPHVARALIYEGVVANFKEAFTRFLDFRAPAYVPHYKLMPSEAVRLIGEAGGLAVFAHPGVSKCDHIIPELMVDGLAGLEVYYSGHRPDQIKHYLNLARKYGLLVTGGSDFHGLDSGREVKLGQLSIPDELVDKLRNEYLRRNKP